MKANTSHISNTLLFLAANDIVNIISCNYFFKEKLFNSMKEVWRKGFTKQELLYVTCIPTMIQDQKLTAIIAVLTYHLFNFRNYKRFLY